MLKLFGTSYGCLHKVGQFTPFDTIRELATRAAIHRGIRRSHREPGGSSRSRLRAQDATKQYKSGKPYERLKRAQNGSFEQKNSPGQSSRQNSAKPGRAQKGSFAQRNGPRPPYSGASVQSDPNLAGILARRDRKFGRLGDAYQPESSGASSARSFIDRKYGNREDDTFGERSESRPDRSFPNWKKQILGMDQTRSRFHAELAQVADEIVGDKQGLGRWGQNDQGTPYASTHSRRTQEGGKSLPRRRRRDKDDAPMAIPYSTPASEFLYGASVIEAALSANRRKLYKLYIYNGEHREEGLQSQDIRFTRLAEQRGAEVKHVRGSWLSLMDKMSSGRPHNGYILEASPLKRPVAAGLMRADGKEEPLEFFPGSQSREELEVNGYSNIIDLQSTYRRYPFVLLLDGVLDTGNLGGMIRSAHFLGVDAVAISTSCGPLNPVALKASAGAVETLPLLSVPDTSGFVELSKQQGWRIYASIAPPKYGNRSGTAGAQEHMTLSSLRNPLMDAPCLLMIGGEGSGLKSDLQKKADYTVSIMSTRPSTSTVDSLNVSVATGILAEAFLRRHKEEEKQRTASADSLF